MADLDNQALRERLAKLLADGPPTAWQERAYTDAQIQAISARLRELSPDDYAAKLHVAGFTDHPYRPRQGDDIEQACKTCMYFERNRAHCIRPELDLPVLPEWACVLWRI